MISFSWTRHCVTFLHCFIVDKLNEISGHLATSCYEIIKQQQNWLILHTGLVFMREQLQKNVQKGGDPISPWHRGQGDDPQPPSTDTVGGVKNAGRHGTSDLNLVMIAPSRHTYSLQIIGGTKTFLFV